MPNDTYEPLIYSGAATGLLKGLNLGKRTVSNYYGPNELDKNQEIERIEIENKRVACAMKNGGIKVFDGTTKQFQFPVKLWKKNHFEKSWCGVHVDTESIIGVSDCGYINTWKTHDIHEQQEINSKAFESSKTVSYFFIRHRSNYFSGVRR